MLWSVGRGGKKQTGVNNARAILGRDTRALCRVRRCRYLGADMSRSPVNIGGLSLSDYVALELAHEHHQLNMKPGTSNSTRPDDTIEIKRVRLQTQIGNLERADTNSADSPDDPAGDIRRRLIAELQAKLTAL